MGTCPPPELCHRSPETLDGNSSRSCPDVDAILTSFVGCRCMFGTLTGLWKASGDCSGASQGPFGGFWGPLGGPRGLIGGCLGSSWAALRSSWGLLALPWGLIGACFPLTPAVGPLLGPLGALLELS